MNLNSPAREQETTDVPPRFAAFRSRVPSWVSIAVALGLYLLALNYARDQVPAGLNNDVAEEALRGVYLLESGRFEAINLYAVTPSGYRFGTSMETLFLYILGAAARLLGTTTLAVHVTTWLFTLAVIALGCRLTQRIEPVLPSWLPLLLTVSSVWLFHYGRSGLRANTAPFFLLAFTLLLDQMEQSPPRWSTGLVCGATLGLSVYSYTSCRVLPLAFVIHALGRLSLNRGERGLLLRRYAALLSGALLVSIPNLLLLLRRPDAFLSRGGYVVRGDPLDMTFNILRTLLLALHYPAYSTAMGPTHAFDGVSIGLTVAGLRPVHPIIGLAFLVGLSKVWRRRRDPAISFVLATWFTGAIVLGISGPSLTRMVILLPFCLIVGALGLGTVLRFRGARPLIVTVLLLVTAFQARDYFVTFAQNPSAQREYRPTATAMGERARELASDGIRVTCVVTGNANVVNYLTHDFHEVVEVLEYLRPSTQEIPLLLQFRPQVILLEHDPGFNVFRAAFMLIGNSQPRSGFDEFTLHSSRE